MEYIKKEELIIGEIYNCANISGSKYIVKIPNDLYNSTNINKDVPRLHKMGNFTTETLQWSLATPEEKHWLNTCIEQDKFITFEEAMKTFIPEYIECIASVTDSFTENKIYKIENFDNNRNFNILDNDNDLRRLLMTGGLWSFKPSTKEAYDAQFVIKEPEFVLPEKWYVKDISKNEIDIVCEYGNKMWSTPNYNCKTWKPTTLAKILVGNYSSGRPFFVNNDFLHNHTEITFDQFKQYVLKENTTVTEEPKVVLEEPKDKVLQRIDLLGKGITIVQVQCSEGGIYKIGDKITVFDKYSPNKGKPFTIKSFRWTNDKSKICAVTELHTPNGIGLDKIELYVEPKIKVKDDFVLPEKWCVEVNEELRNRFGYFKAYGYHHSIQINDTNKWSNKIKEGFTEITFEQFKKYVLKDE